MNERGKSDRPVVPVKPPNKAAQPAAEVVEGRGLAKGNADQQNAFRTQSRTRRAKCAGTRASKRTQERARFTALLHHVMTSIASGRRTWALSPSGRDGVDGVTWQQYGEDLEENLRDSRPRSSAAAYRAKPSRGCTYRRADGRQRPLGIRRWRTRSLQRAVVEVLNAIYEADFLGFSYGFRPGRAAASSAGRAGVGISKKGELDTRCGHSGYFDTSSMDGW